MEHYFELSLRNDHLSGRLSTDIRQHGTLPLDSRPIIILVHGFNNNYKQAMDSFDAFLANLKRSTATSSMPKSICRLFWPGNLTNALASKLSYAQQVPKSLRCAAMLSDYLVDLAKAKPDTPIILIAHSLGCRLVLETILHAESRYPEMAGRFRLSILMAAAVPGFMVNDRYGRLYPVRLSEKKFFGLHSNSDNILRVAFPAGQTLAGEGFFPSALGLKGNPKSFWSAGDCATGLTHGDYWQDQENSAVISTTMGQSSKRHLPQRKLAMHRQAYYWLNELGER
ncbi:hypothetical protein GCM10022289_45160 [Pedobacter jeongneungensis]|uniref:Alpha/beta hydrolase family protein n=1 Tax=Pedobacter jeongneungensis TaxID=947309 RepID=A0ABP8BQ21_9SPHI